ncbi:SGNH/GDSL hydrolase family protein [Formosa algae]|uniref:Lysophospholipase L1-like esterase n=1 Tax=Formosa algae TaxID=225843 RepID=A0A9X0YMC4_9FLAO|nr:SGNH/GDSL hydrolase family protein [Formosa algae]MBP1841226.1 lysophospholipase L1-like esterase [Formosa algae]MDQ0336851.1 lysophospholipase L1-like esterase [Formosa algae]
MDRIKISLLLVFCSAIFMVSAQEQSNFRESNFIKPNDRALRFNGVLFSKVTESEAELHRYTEDFFNSGFDGTLEITRARTQPGISISFKTNSPLITLKFDKLENSQGRKRRFTIFKDDVKAYDFIKDLEFTIANPSKETSEWAVYLPHFSGVKFLGLELSEGYTLSDLPKVEKRLYVAIGNSITHGVGQSGTIDTYPYRVADDLGFDYVNLATGGSEISIETLRNFDGLSPRLITVLWGYNDVTYEADPINGVLPIYETLIGSLCSRFPQADIICVSQTFTTTVVGKVNPENRIDVWRHGSTAVIEKLQKEYDNLHLVRGLGVVTSEADLKDSVHLNKQGAKKLAAAIVAKYQAENK